MTIELLAEHVRELFSKEDVGDASIEVRPLGGTMRLKVERSQADGRRYVDFAYIGRDEAAESGVEECFTWIFGEYARQDPQKNYDSRRYGSAVDAREFVERWIVHRVPNSHLPPFKAGPDPG